ncbi:hypothetical protein QW71_12445 [Paenibacillus sp. IHB B 3415]|uniref:hypothetical protein n=1 Tax=Paenibacillus sp. IHB B 3415 TaxID=867080 RepID=UPI0005756B24|nr:hypothetical protein [Paenibacillus sp. IHB B 3415]KHL95509.1 hypothetical protein QW71_12445 [Paenibacillus sp. IHB B 3415]
MTKHIWGYNLRGNNEIDFKHAFIFYTEENITHDELYPHPVFGPMDVAQWVDFIGIHEERHLAQLKEALDGI